MIGFRDRIQGSDSGVRFSDWIQGSDSGVGPRDRIEGRIQGSDPVIGFRDRIQGLDAIVIGLWGRTQHPEIVPNASLVVLSAFGPVWSCHFSKAF